MDTAPPAPRDLRDVDEVLGMLGDPYLAPGAARFVDRSVHLSGLVRRLGWTPGHLWKVVRRPENGVQMTGPAAPAGISLGLASVSLLLVKVAAPPAARAAPPEVCELWPHMSAASLVHVLFSLGRSFARTRCDADTP